MTKYFCDKCETEITESNQCIGGSTVESRLGTEIEFRTKDLSPVAASHRLKLELMHSFNGTWNNGIFCKYCVIDAFMRLDDRPSVQ